MRRVGNISQRENREMKAATPATQFLGSICAFGFLILAGTGALRWMYRDSEMEGIYKKERNQGRTSLEE